jgi:hypothetical protein
LFPLRLRAWIVWSLGAGGVLLLVAVVAAVLWGILRAVGDHSGAAGARAVLLVAGACWVLDFIVLVVLLAFAQLAVLPRSRIEP